MLNFLGWLITSLVVFTLVRIALRWDGRGSRKSIVYSGGSAEGVGFYFLFGVSTVLYQLGASMAEAAAVTGLCYAIAAVLLWMGRARGENGAPFVERAVPSELRTFTQGEVLDSASEGVGSG